MSDLFDGLDLGAADVAVLEETAAQIALAGPLLPPPPSLRARLLENLEPKTYLVSRAADSGWQPFGPPGIDVKMLMKDPLSGARSFLLRLQPGAVLPQHSHQSAEHCYVLEGELHDADHAISTGDYELRLPGSDHAPVTTGNGAVVLIIAGPHDEHAH